MISVATDGSASIVDRQLVHVGPFPTLTMRDRCDRCPAQARVAVRLRATGGRLAFCGHHYGRHEAALKPLVDAVLDRRGDIA